MYQYQVGVWLFRSLLRNLRHRSHKTNLLGFYNVITPNCTAVDIQHTASMTILGLMWCLILLLGATDDPQVQSTMPLCLRRHTTKCRSRRVTQFLYFDYLYIHFSIQVCDSDRTLFDQYARSSGYYFLGIWTKSINNTSDTFSERRCSFACVSKDRLSLFCHTGDINYF